MRMRRFDGEGRGREEVIQQIVSYLQAHPESTASLAVCRRALGFEPPRVDASLREELAARLQQMPDPELEACYYIVS